MQTNSQTPALTLAIEKVGLQAIADACNVSYQAVRKWERKGMPRTEWTGETSYAEKIEEVTRGEVTKAYLLCRSVEHPPRMKPKPQRNKRH